MSSSISYFIAIGFDCGNYIVCSVHCLLEDSNEGPIIIGALTNPMFLAAVGKPNEWLSSTVCVAELFANFMPYTSHELREGDFSYMIFLFWFSLQAVVVCRACHNSNLVGLVCSNCTMYSISTLQWIVKN